MAREWFRGKDFFTSRKGFQDVDLVLCNPPFSGNPDLKEMFAARFVLHILKTVPATTAIAFFAPFPLLLNSRIRTNDYAKRPNRYAWLRDEVPAITSVIPLPQDVYCVDGARPLVHSQILLFNMPLLPPCIFVPQEYLGW